MRIGISTTKRRRKDIVPFLRMGIAIVSGSE